MPSSSLVIHTGCEFYAGISRQPAGCSWPGHRQNCNFVLCTTGRAQVTEAGESVTFGPGSLLWFAPGRARDFQALSEWEACWVHYDGREMGDIEPAWDPKRGICRLLNTAGRDYRLLRHIFLQICLVAAERRQGWRQLGYTLIRECILRGNMLAESGLPPEHIQLAIDFLSKLDPPIPMDEVAAACGMSHAAFYTKFKETFGVTPRRYRENELIRRMRYLLETTDWTLAKIAAKLGGCSEFYLSNRFRKLVGEAPSAYRKRIHSGEPSSLGMYR